MDRLVVAAGLVWLSGEPARLLVQRRSPTASYGAGLLELPGGKLERGEAPRVALARELAEEWGPQTAALSVGPVVDVLHHVYPDPGPEVLLIVIHVDGRAWSDGRWRAAAQPVQAAELHEFSQADLPIEQFLAADRPFVSVLRSGAVRPPWE